MQLRAFVQECLNGTSRLERSILDTLERTFGIGRSVPECLEDIPRLEEAVLECLEDIPRYGPAGHRLIRPPFSSTDITQPTILPGWITAPSRQKRRFRM